MLVGAPGQIVGAGGAGPFHPLLPLPDLPGQPQQTLALQLRLLAQVQPGAAQAALAFTGLLLGQKSLLGRVGPQERLQGGVEPRLQFVEPASPLMAPPPPGPG